MERRGASPEEIQYVEALLPEPSKLFEQARQSSVELGKDHMRLSSREARILSFLVAAHGSQKFVEIGTLTGYSALWLLHGMPGGKLWTLEKDEKHAAVAREILSKWEGPAQAEVVVGDAVETLKNLSQYGPFDGIFIDGNKSAYGTYLDWAEQNVKIGGIIIADNVYLSGGVFGKNTGNEYSQKQFQLMRVFNQRLADPARFSSVILPTVEGLFVASKKA